MKIVFAQTTGMVSAGPGNHTMLHEGDHWPASDPLVQAHPAMFSDDPRPGLRFSVAPGEDDKEPTVEEATAAVEAAQKKLDEAKERVNARQQEAPIEQATKAPGEKRTTRRG